MNLKTIRYVSFGKISAALAAAGLFAVVYLLVSGGNIGQIDYSQYWAGVKLFLAGENPYNRDLIWGIERKLGVNVRRPVLMWNPPLILLISTPLSLIPFKLSAYLWLIISGVLYVFTVCSLWKALNPGGRGGLEPFVGWTGEVDNLYLTRSLVFAFFYPIALSIFHGQISPVLLIGFGFFLINLEKGEGHFFKAGIFLSLTLIKFHILYLLYLSLLIYSLRARQWRILGGFAVGGGVLFAFPLLVNSGIYRLYLDALAHPPVYWQTPTLGSMLQGFSGVHRLWMRAIPSVLTGVFASVLFMTMKPAKPSFFHCSTIAVLSCLTSTYCWIFDHLLLIPAYIWIFTETAKCSCGKELYHASSFLLLAAAAGMFFSGGTGQQTAVWYPIVVLFVSVLVRYKSKA